VPTRLVVQAYDAGLGAGREHIRAVRTKRNRREAQGLRATLDTLEQVKPTTFWCGPATIGRRLL
jgi:hypothetical protein